MSTRAKYAFPYTEDACDPGMTLRDYFAAKAMQAFLNRSHPSDGAWECEAEAAYEIADAMLAARNTGDNA